MGCKANSNSFMNRISWEDYALLLAKVAALRSKDPSTKVGACVLRRGMTVASTGYNGPPPGIDISCWENRDEKLRRVVHAEMNALKYLKPGEGFLLATTSSPCSNCLPIICSYGIKKIVFETYYNRDNYVDQLCREFGIELEQRKINSLLLQNLM